METIFSNEVWDLGYNWLGTQTHCGAYSAPKRAVLWQRRQDEVLTEKEKQGEEQEERI